MKRHNRFIIRFIAKFKCFYVVCWVLSKVETHGTTDDQLAIKFVLLKNLFYSYKYIYIYILSSCNNFSCTDHENSGKICVTYIWHQIINVQSIRILILLHMARLNNYFLYKELVNTQKEVKLNGSDATPKNFNYFNFHYRYKLYDINLDINSLPTHHKVDMNALICYSRKPKPWRDQRHYKPTAIKLWKKNTEIKNSYNKSS